MEITAFILKKFVLGLLEVLVLAMLVRAVLSWFDRGEPGPVLSFLLFLTEPFIMPIRRLCERMHWFEGMPFDMPFMITSLILMALQSLLIML